MTGSIPFGNIPGPPGESWFKAKMRDFIFLWKKIQWQVCFVCFQLFQLQLQAKPWTCHHSHWPHIAFSCPTCSTLKRKDDNIWLMNAVNALKSQDFKHFQMCLFRENDPSWANEIQDDVIEECNKHGGIVHIYVDKNSTQVSGEFHLTQQIKGKFRVQISPQDVCFCCRVMCMWSVPQYQQQWQLSMPFMDAGLQVCDDISIKPILRNIFGFLWSLVSLPGKMITAAYVPLPTYHNLFPDSVTAKQLLVPTRR